ncbi:MAG: EAL domain-containing protein [Campylobacterales bacterium]|nr:EAL domain-containing protein [Campylobacterales bacterium]
MFCLCFLWCGDEFIFLGRDFADKEACLERALEISHQLLESVKSTYLLGDHHLYISASIGEICLHYQPQVNQAQKIIGCEVLARWKNKDLGIVLPDLFIPIAEQTGLVIELGSYILEEALKPWYRSRIEGSH